jgi:DNA-binding NarL/FixJ family response regulator
MKTVKILLLDDHQIILDGLKTMLMNDKHLCICDACLSGVEALKSALINHPDIIISDLMMPDMSGLEFIKHVKSYKITSKILILSMCISSDVIQEAVQAGADGFIMKQNASRDELLKAINLLVNNETYFNTEGVTIMSNKSKPEKGYQTVSFDNLDISVLSKSEFQVLELYADGFSNKEISVKLGITIKSVEKHKSSIISKLNLKSYVDLIKFAIKNNMCYI